MENKMFYKITTYGCQMNVHESEKIAGLLEGIGYTENNDGVFDIVVFNTCCIRDTAEKRALGNIGILKSEKKKNPNLIIAVVGCMAQQEGMPTIIKEQYPYVDIVLGTRNISYLPIEIEKVLLNRKTKRKNDKKYRGYNLELPSNYLDIDEKNPQLRTSFPNAWVNIIYGCNNFCTYCIVPYVRGREISRDINNILEEVTTCVNNGYKEITLLGQNVNSYGNDLDDTNINFATLLKEIDKISGEFRVRFMTSHPKDLNDEIIDAMANSTKICNNLHLPIQAGSNKVLNDMNRKYSREHYLQIIEKLRKAMPNIAITTDIMVGFPTESEEDFLDTMDIIEKVRFSSAFTFIFSARKGTPANDMQQIPYQIKQERLSRLIALQNKITKEQSQDYINGVYEVLAEDFAPKHKDMLCGRTESGRLVCFEAKECDIGKLLKIKIHSARSSSLIGKIVD